MNQNNMLIVSMILVGIILIEALIMAFSEEKLIGVVMFIVGLILGASAIIMMNTNHPSTHQNYIETLLIICIITASLSTVALFVLLVELILLSISNRIILSIFTLIKSRENEERRKGTYARTKFPKKKRGSPLQIEQ